MNDHSQPQSAVESGETRTPETEVSCLQAELADLRSRYEELRFREAYFRHLTEYSADLITIFDADATIRFESRSIELELGYSPTQYRGRKAFEFIHPDDWHAVRSVFAEALLRRGNTPRIRFRFLHSDGTYRVLEGCGNNLLDDPAVSGIVFNSSDVTERVQLEEQVERARSEKEDTIARLTGGVAHDFNNILTAIQGLAELAGARLMHGSPEARYLAEIRDAAVRAGGLTQQLLAFSHRLVLQPQVLSLASWLEWIEPRLQKVLDSSKVELTIATHGDGKVWIDPGQIEQVLVHLTENARDAMPAGGRLTIEALPASQEIAGNQADGRCASGGFIKLSIADQGCGMGRAVLARIFEPFFTTKQTGYHPGLGLCMCRGIIEQSGGHLTVSSIPGRGTVFYVFLPVAESVAEETIVATPPDGALTEAPAGCATILLVDDEPMLREIGETVLSDAGYHVLVADDGASALQRLAELGSAPLDLLLTDVVLPGMSGVQLAEEVARLRPATRILLCSGYTRDALATGGALPPGLGFLPKPYTLSGFLAKVQEVLPRTQVGRRGSGR